MIQITTAHNQARLAGSLDYINQGGGTAAIQVFTGTRPALGGSSGALLASMPLPTPAGTVSGNQLVLATPIEGLIISTGQASWARIVNRNGDIVADCDVGQVDSEGGVLEPGDLMLNQLTLYEGGTLRLVSGVLG